MAGDMIPAFQNREVSLSSSAESMGRDCLNSMVYRDWQDAPPDTSCRRSFDRDQAMVLYIDLRPSKRLIAPDAKMSC